MTDKDEFISTPDDVAKFFGVLGRAMKKSPDDVALLSAAECDSCERFIHDYGKARGHNLKLHPTPKPWAGAVGDPEAHEGRS